jgi:FlgD Ig-like domain
MGRWLFMLFALGGVWASKAQTVRETFSDADLSQNPTWLGTRQDFDVSGGWLNLAARAPGFFWLSTPVEVLDTAVWEGVLWTGLSPSNQNYGRIVLASDSANLATAYTGWQLSVGATGAQDGLDLYRVLRGRRRLVATFAPGKCASPFNYPLKVSRSPSGLWRVWADTARQGLRLMGTVQDTARLQGRFFGLEAECTSSFRTFFWHWDDLAAHPGPRVLSNQRLAAAHCAGRRLYVVAPKGVRPSGNAEAEVDGSRIPLPFSQGNDGRYLTRFLGELPVPPGADSAYRFELTLRGWQDSLGLAIAEQSFACKCLPEARRLQLTELKVGEGGPLGQPTLPEFVEVRNPATHAVWLEGLDIADATFFNRNLPADSLGAGGYRVYTSLAGVGPVRAAGAADVVAATLPSLNDDGDRLRIRLQGRGVDSLLYLPAQWVRSADVGALSLERGPACLPRGPWYPSRAVLGATPGSAPTYDWAADTSLAPKLSGAIYIAGQGLHLRLFPRPDTAQALGEITLTSTPPLPLGELIRTDSTLVYRTSSPPDSTTAYNLILNMVRGCAGATRPSAYTYIVPVSPAQGRLVINELLYDPVTGSQPFVELYNASDKWVQLGGLGLVRQRDALSDTVYLPLTTPAVEPKGYRWLAREQRPVVQVYPKAVASGYLYLKLPSLEVEGTLTLLAPNGAVVDALAYSSALHSEGNRLTEGVSLERVAAQVATSQRENWQSAAGQPAATPGYVNSQSAPANPDAGPGLTATPEAFSPNTDGYQDVTTLVAEGLLAGTQGRITVFDASGQLVRRLALQTTTGPTFTAIWDGRTDAGSLAGPGIYVVLAEFYHPAKRLAKRRCVVGLQP